MRFIVRNYAIGEEVITVYFRLEREIKVFEVWLLKTVGRYKLL